MIPERIITRPPSAELRPDQTDQDSLPPYDVLDAIIRKPMSRKQIGRRHHCRGYTEADVKRVVRLIKINEYKATPGAGGRADHSARLRRRLALPDHQQVSARAVNRRLFAQPPAKRLYSRSKPKRWKSKP